MKPEMLDALLLDRDLGELSPEVGALLEAHLAQNPAAATRAAEFSATLRLARAATAAPPAVAPRTLDRARLQREHRALRSATRRAEMLRLAACLLIGLGAGWLARAPQPPAAIAATPPAATPTRAFVASADSPARFWSLARLAAEQDAASASTRRRESRYELHWNSPARVPQAKEKL